MKHIAQSKIIDKIQAYLKATNGEVELDIESGLCSGLVTFWLTCMANQRMQLHDSIIDYILNLAIDNQIVDQKMEEIISAFIIMHYNFHYLENQSQNNLSSSVELIKPDPDIRVLTEQSKLINSFTANELSEILQSIPQEGLLRISNTQHTIAVYKSNQGLIIYDPNLHDRQEIQTNNLNAANIIRKIFKVKPEELCTVHISALNHPYKDFQYAFPNDILNKSIQDLDQSLLLAIASGDTQLVSHHIKKGANINIHPDGNCPIYTAISTHQYPAVQLLLQSGAQLNVQTQGNSTLLHATILQSKLIYHDSYPVDLSFIILNMLLESGADPNFKNILGISAANLAVHKGKLEKLALLIAYGAILTPYDVDLLIQKYKNTPELLNLCHNIVNFQVQANRNVTLPQPFLDYCSKNPNIDKSNSDNVWDLYEYMLKLNKGSLSKKLFNELKDVLYEIKKNVLAVRAVNSSTDLPSQLLHTINSLQQFVNIKRTGFYKLRLSFIASSVQNNVLKHLSKILDLNSTSNVTARLQQLNEQYKITTKRNKLQFLTPKEPLNLEQYPVTNNILQLLNKKRD